MKYIIVLDNTFLAGTSPSNGVVDIGLGNKIIFSAGAYNTGQSHWLECVSWGGLLGVSDDTLDNALSGVGARYEAFGMNGKWPCLRFIKNPSALCNTSGVPQKVTGVDVDFEVYTVGETFQHITGVGASIIWGFSQSAALHTSKSYISKRACGEANPGHESRFLINRRDSSATPSTVECTSDGNTFADLDPRIMVDCITSNGQMYHGGVPCRALGNVNMHLGVATNVDRYGLGNFKLSSSAFSTANQWLGRVTAQAITKPQSPSKRIEICKALLGIPLS